MNDQNQDLRVEPEVDLDTVFALQNVFIANQVTKLLEERDVELHGLAEQLIAITRETSSEEEFVTKVEQIISVNVSKHFLASLYTTIKQKLPRPFEAIKIVLSPIKNEPIKQIKQEEKKQVVQEEIQENQSLQKVEQKENQDDEGKKKFFPGLSIPNNDEIQLDLELDQGNPIEEKSEKPKAEKDQEMEKRQNIPQRVSPRRSPSSDRKKHKKKKESKKRKYQERERSRSRHKKHKNRRQQSQQQPQILTQGQIYRGKILSVHKIGCTLKLYNVDCGDKQLIMHIEEMGQRQYEAGEKVFVRVLSILPDRVRCSMKDVDQRKGRDLRKREKSDQQKDFIAQDRYYDYNRDVGQLTGIKIEHQANVDAEGNGTSYGQIWELSRLSYMGGITKAKPTVNEDIEEVVVEVNEKQPPFLRGQTTKAGINLSPVRVVKNPEGTLQREALNAAQYAKERRQIREQKNKAEVRDLQRILDEVTPKHEYTRQPKRTAQTIKSQKNNLPIHAYKEQLVKACMDNKVLIVIGETGSGKTTQITQYLHQAGFSKRGKIGCTQPRRVAAMSISKRVCEEMGVKLGQQVGYSIRFEDCTSSKTIIKYMTDGMLLRQALIDKELRQYSVIMLDQAHERTINTDVLFGILKKIVQRRDDFTLIVTSATLQAKKFSTYFFDCKIFSIPGRTYNVQILYAKDPEIDYLDASLMCIMQIHLDQPSGDILLFLTGQEEIDTSCQILKERLRKMGDEIPELIILPVYSALPSELQTRIFEPAAKGKRKCIIATNIAEASLTIDGIFYVVDPGFAKVKIYNSKLGMDTLVVAPISQASAKQRAGRAGRTGPGKCYRLYTEQAYRCEMLPTSVPEIQRANLSNTVLELKAMGINDLINFDFMDAPPVQTLIAALEQLYYLSALDDEGLLTKLGRRMAEFPLEPPLSKMLLTSIDFGCAEQIITIISMLSVQNIFYRPKQKETIADEKKTKFNHFEGDHLTLLAVYQAWKKQKERDRSNWCHDNYIQSRSLNRAENVRDQILKLLKRYKFHLTSCGSNSSLIRKTIVSGFFFHAAKKDPKGGYRTLVDDHQVYIHPSSSLFNKQPEWVVYHELIFTTKQYMRDVCAINPKWLIDVAPNFFKFTDQVGYVRKKRNEKLDPLNQKYGDPNAWRLSKRKG